MNAGSDPPDSAHLVRVTARIRIRAGTTGPTRRRDSRSPTRSGPAGSPRRRCRRRSSPTCRDAAGRETDFWRRGVQYGYGGDDDSYPLRAPCDDAFHLSHHFSTHIDVRAGERRIRPGRGTRVVSGMRLRLGSRPRKTRYVPTQIRRLVSIWTRSVNNRSIGSVSARLFRDFVTSNWDFISLDRWRSSSCQT